MQIRKVLLFAMILLVGLTVVTAADITDDDSAVAVETPQVEQTANDIGENVQTDAQVVDEIEDNDILEDELTNELVISEDVTIDSSNVSNFSNRNWTVNEGVTVTGTTGVSLSNVAITVAGNYVTLDKLTINTNNNTKLIDATGTSNLTITDSSLTLSNFGTSGNNQAIAIDLTDAANVSITGTAITLNAPSQGQTWKNDTGYWYSVLDVSGILVNNAENITINQNNIHVINTTEKIAYSTMPAITIKNGTENINVTFNTIYSTGAHFVYGIMMNDGVTNAALKNNTITVIDKLYVAGIDASTAIDSVVSGNQITATSNGQTSYDPIVGEESLAYGIISDTYDMGNQNNRICKNTITATANTVYGIEVYKGNNITVCSNNIYGTGNKTMGVAFAHTNNSKIINNFMRLTGTTEPYHSFYEEVTPVNAGIIFTNQSNGNWIQGNDIEITAEDDDSVTAINLQNSTTATVTGNLLSAIYNELYPVEGNDAVSIDDLCSNISLLTNEGVVPYACNCGCMNNNNDNIENQFFL
ncbi:hypothetical protein [Methanosphaera sp. BMS]|uniref:hypothetical protein n=1 Tax=Methanosphaera sp. BMS TaxID=1789762 RepID=UPI000DC1D040|nr:hypothetical protein [Methanosphaera sp. BMS]AWX32002.1 hypothetical protein AW729_02325 [Methanosphaera sp. BMS]